MLDDIDKFEFRILKQDMIAIFQIFFSKLNHSITLFKYFIL